MQDFHESMSVRGGRLYAIIADVCAFANTNGGTLFVGMSADTRKPVAGIQNTVQAISQLDKEISNRISPPLHCTIDAHKANGKNVLRVLVPAGDDPPYVVDDYKIYVRSESETGLAVRDEIVSLVKRGQKEVLAAPAQAEPSGEEGEEPAELAKEKTLPDAAPRTGVEIVSVEERSGTKYYTVRDLRNGNVVKNVTRKSARRLWHYAITQYAQLPADLSRIKVEWGDGLGLLKRDKQGKRERYDLVQKSAEGYRYYFGVTEDGIHGPWKQLVGHDED